MVGSIAMLLVLGTFAVVSFVGSPSSQMPASGRHGISLRTAPHQFAMNHDPPRHGRLLKRRNAVGLATAAVASKASASQVIPTPDTPFPKVTVTTTEGPMEFELWDDAAPKHVKSFLSLAKQGFFDGGAFHRIIPGFVIQGGDPNAKVGYGPDGTLKGGDKAARRKWGTGGPGYNVPAEFNPRIHEFGVLSMARSADPDSAGSQFFVCLGRLNSLDNK